MEESFPTSSSTTHTINESKGLKLCSLDEFYNTAQYQEEKLSVAELKKLPHQLNISWNILKVFVVPLSVCYVSVDPDISTPSVPAMDLIPNVPGLCSSSIIRHGKLSANVPEAQIQQT